MDDVSDRAWDIFKTINDFIRLSDSKAAVILAFAGGSAAFLSARTGELHEVIKNHGMDGWGLILYFAVLTYLFALLCSVFGALRSIWPSLGGTEEERSLIFFKHIAEDYQGKHSDYAKALGDLGDGEMVDHLAQQICVNAAIATTKFNSVGRAVRALVVALGAWAVIMVVLLLLGGQATS